MLKPIPIASVKAAPVPSCSVGIPKMEIKHTVAKYIIQAI